MMTSLHLTERIRFAFDRRNPSSNVSGLNDCILLCLSFAVTIVPFFMAGCILVSAAVVIKKIITHQTLSMILLFPVVMIFTLIFLTFAIICMGSILFMGLILPILMFGNIYYSFLSHHEIISLSVTPHDKEHILHSVIPAIMSYCVWAIFYITFLPNEYKILYNMILLPLLMTSQFIFWLIYQ